MVNTMINNMMNTMIKLEYYDIFTNMSIPFLRSCSQH